MFIKKAVGFFVKLFVAFWKQYFACSPEFNARYRAMVLSTRVSSSILSGFHDFEKPQTSLFQLEKWLSLYFTDDVWCSSILANGK